MDKCRRRCRCSFYSREVLLQQMHIFSFFFLHTIGTELLFSCCCYRCKMFVIIVSCCNVSLAIMQFDDNATVCNVGTEK